jgi:ribosomal protein S14
MTWEKEWTGKRKKAIPNKMQKKPTIAFRSNMSPEALGYIKKLSGQKAKSQFINQAIEMRHFYMTNRRGFLRQTLEYNFELCRHLLRKIGNRK